jgi:hypothetical protein
VSVFVELYVKNRQLREQAELLRNQLDADRGAARRALASADSAALPAPGDPAGDATTDGSEPEDQAGPDGEEQAGGAQPLLLELSGRLAAVEDLVGVLSGQAAVSTDTAIADCVNQLEHRVGRLRDALDALRVG